MSLCKHAYAICCDFYGYKYENLQTKLCGIFLIFALIIDCGYSLEPVLRSTHNLCFEAVLKSTIYVLNKNEKDM